ncbi:MAG: hypothetical protein K8R54_12000 [Bacteroidales bacterium]|nr:hypothetical protein [Bacteroidales bacterium]
MAKKSFIGGLDNLLASAGLKKKIDVKEDITKEIKETEDLSDDEKHWLLIKLDNLKEELKLWRSGKISIDKFHESLKEQGLKYNSETNEFQEI